VVQLPLKELHKAQPDRVTRFLRSSQLVRKAHDQCLQASPGSTPGSGTTRTTSIRALTSQCSSLGRASVSKLNVAGSIPVIATQSSIFTRSFSLSLQYLSYEKSMGALHGLVAASVKRLHEGSSPSVPTTSRIGIVMTTQHRKHGPMAPSKRWVYDAMVSVSAF
jgi:hypothetical protein